MGTAECTAAYDSAAYLCVSPAAPLSRLVDRAGRASGVTTGVF